MKRKHFDVEKGNGHNSDSKQVVGYFARIQPMKSIYCQSQLCCCPLRGASQKLKKTFADNAIWLLPNSSCCSIHLLTLFKVKPANSRPKLHTNCLPCLRLTAANCVDGSAISLNFSSTIVDDSHSCSGQDGLYSTHNAAHCRERQT